MFLSLIYGILLTYYIYIINIIHIIHTNNNNSKLSKAFNCMSTAYLLPYTAYFLIGINGIIEQPTKIIKQ